MVTKRIWLYWENRPGFKRPPYLDLTLESIQCHSGEYEVLLLDEHSVKRYLKIPFIVRRFSQISQKADYIRFNLLFQYGGVWLDIDTILLRNIGDAIEPFIAGYDYIGYGRKPGQPSIGFMACKKGCRLLEMHLEEMNKVLQRKFWQQIPPRKVQLGWSEIGYDILWNLANKYDYYHHERNMFAPTAWEDWKHFFRTDVNIDEYLSHNPFGVVLYNKMMFDSLHDLSAHDIMNKNTLLSQLFKRAGVSSVR